MTGRRRALSVILSVTGEGAYANLALKDALSGTTRDEARFVTALALGTLEKLLYLDYVLGFYTSPNKNAAVVGVLRLCTYELLFMRTPAHAAINGAGNLCREIGKGALTGYVNGVLRRLEREKDTRPPLPEDALERLSIEYSLPLPLCERFVRDYGAEFTEKLLSVSNAGFCVHAQYPSSAEELLPALPGPVRRGQWDENALYPAGGFDVAACHLFSDGRLSVQGEGAMLSVRALGDCRGKSVLDACAAPGGKSAYIASLSENDVALTCFELHPHRAELLQKTLSRLGVTACVLEKDATVFDPAYAGAFDAVLLDAPCSGLGMLREKPDLKYKKTPADIDALSAVQKTLLDVCAQYVKPGGVLVYATCTVTKAENEEQVSSFLAAHPAFTRSPMPLPIENDGQLQLLPFIHGLDGFYMARMVRCS